MNLTLGLLIGFIVFLIFWNPNFPNTAKSTLLREYNVGGTIKWNELAIKHSVYGIDKNLILGMIAQESGGIRDAIGDNGESIGLMQIQNPALQDVNQTFGLKYSFSDLHEPEINIQVGTLYLSYLKNKWLGNTQKAIQSYNAGYSTVEKNPDASINYYNSVIQYQEIFKERL